MLPWSTGRQLGRSRVDKRTLNPEWGFKCSFVIGRKEWDDAVENFHLLEGEGDEEPFDMFAESRGGRQPPRLLDHSRMLFDKYDKKKSGDVSWEMFWQVLSGEKITYSDLISYGQARGSSLEPFEVEAVMAMDKEYQAFVAEKVKAARNA
jgi:hypothetical protein